MDQIEAEKEDPPLSNGSFWGKNIMPYLDLADLNKI